MHHLKVLRLKEGERVELFDGRGSARLYAMRGGALLAEGPVRKLPRPGFSATLFACITKGSRWDWTIEKAVELGVARIVPVISERTIVRLGKEERFAKAQRWRRVAEDAARQSDAMWTAQVDEPVDFQESLALVRELDACFVGALADPPPPPLLEAVMAKFPSGGVQCGARAGLFIGPEGDFAPEELSALAACGTPVSLGPTVLRAETAAIAALAVLLAALAR